MASSSPFACRVCGLLQSELPWGDDGQCPTYDICDCCGVEFGYEDCTVEATRRYRQKWIERGSPWTRPESCPEAWDPEEQLEAVPPEFR